VRDPFEADQPPRMSPEARTDLTIHHICGVEELRDAPLRDADRVVSILDPGSPDPPELQDLDKPVLALRFDDALHSEAGNVIPAEEHIRALLAFDARAGADERLVIHCAAGISRSTAALAILLSARYPDCEDEIFSAIRAIRSRAWPNARMVEIGDRLLDRRGALTSALRRHYRVQVQRFPELSVLLSP
jgi:predicted protein tyrosine phosphatase